MLRKSIVVSFQMMVMQRQKIWNMLRRYQFDPICPLILNLSCTGVGTIVAKLDSLVIPSRGHNIRPHLWTLAWALSNLKLDPAGHNKCKNAPVTVASLHLRGMWYRANPIKTLKAFKATQTHVTARERPSSEAWIDGLIYDSMTPSKHDAPND